jgi:hypothetical protein
MAYISNALRQLVAARAHELCEYCQTAQTIVIEMELDHIVPCAAGQRLYVILMPSPGYKLVRAGPMQCREQLGTW